MKLKILLFLLVLPFSVMAANTNVFDNIFVNNKALHPSTGQILFGTNIFSSAASLALGTTPAFPAGLITIDDAGISGRAAEFSFGDFDGTSGLGRIYHSPTANEVSIEAFRAGSLAFYGNTGTGGDLITFVPGGGGSITLRLTAALSTYGVNSSSAHTYNGSTITYNHLATVNGGVLVIPPAGGTVTNQTHFTSLGVITATNITVVAPTDLIARITTVAGVTNLIITSNGAAGLLETRARYGVTTNTPTAALPIVNNIYTNMLRRLNLSVAANFGINSSAAIWTVDGNNTNYYSRTTRATAETQGLIGRIQPLALYMLTNFTGTVTPVAGEWNEVRE